MRGRGWKAVAAAIALLMAGCPAPEAPHSDRDPLDARWLGQPAAIHGRDLARLAELGANDAEVTALFAEATRELGGTLDAVASHMSICPANVTQEGGLTVVKGYRAIVSRPITEVLAGAASPTADAARLAIKLSARVTRRVDDRDSVRFQLTLMPEICFVERLTVGEAYEAVVHELVHALHYDPQLVETIAVSSPDETTFLRRIVLARGGEVEAYSLSTRARLRMPGGHFFPALGAVLDIKSPTPIAPERMADAILAPRPRGLGYADGLLRGKYQEVVASERAALGDERGLFTKLLGQRREFLEYLVKRDAIDRNNLRVFEHNAEVATSRGDAALLAESQRRHAETEASIAKSRVMTEVANESIAAVSARIAEVERQLGALPHG